MGYKRKHPPVRSPMGYQLPLRYGKYAMLLRKPCVACSLCVRLLSHWPYRLVQALRTSGLRVMLMASFFSGGLVSVSVLWLL